MRRAAMRGVVMGLVAMAIAAFQPTAAVAESPKHAKPAKRAPSIAPELAAKLSSNDEAQIKSALDDVRLGGKGSANAVPIVDALLERGISLSLTEAALDTLADIESPESSSAIALYATHRNLKVRSSAVRALGHTGGDAAVAALRHALSDQDPAVRGAAATGLGSLRASSAVGDLIIALDHQVNEAAASIGQLCSQRDCDLLVSKLGRVPFDVITGGLDQILFRPSREIDDDEKVKIIGRVRELGTREANKFLIEVQKKWPKGGSGRVKQAIDQGVSATSGGPQ
jgi:HEAT repeat protein